MEISKARWDESIKTQTKNSLFITKLGHNGYGSKALSIRTVGQPKEPGKIMATPKKVDAMIGRQHQF